MDKKATAIEQMKAILVQVKGIIAQVTQAAAQDIAALSRGKQDKIIGTPGQAVVIGPNGTVEAQDAGTGLSVYAKLFAASAWTGTTTKTISIPASEHGLSGWPSVQIYVKSGSSYVSGTWGTMSVGVSVDVSRNITLTYQNTAFEGMAVITG